MADIRSKLQTFYSLEQLARENTVIHRLHPLAKLLTTFIYLICLLSLDSYALHRLAPFLFYPIICIVSAELPPGMILRRAALVVPLPLLAGIGNVFLNRTPAAQIGGFTISAGIFSLLVLVLRTLLSVSSVLLLVAVTPISKLTNQLRCLHVPEVLIVLTEIIYRFLGILADEAASVITSFRLRSGGRQWPSMSMFGSMAGQLLLRSTDRAERVCHAMQCRCWHLGLRRAVSSPWKASDWLFLLLGAGSAILFREFDLMMIIGEYLHW